MLKVSPHRLSFLAQLLHLHLTTYLPTYVHSHTSIDFTHAGFYKERIASILDSNAQNQPLAGHRALNTMDLTDTLDPTAHETAAADDPTTVGDGYDDNKEINGMIHKEENKFQKAIASWRSMAMVYPTFSFTTLKVQ